MHSLCSRVSNATDLFFLRWHLFALKRGTAYQGSLHAFPSEFSGYSQQDVVGSDDGEVIRKGNEAHGQKRACA